MAESDAIHLFKRLETREKVTVILELLRAYRGLDEDNIDTCKKSLDWAFGWWGITLDTVATDMIKKIENGDIKDVKTDLFKIIVTLVYVLSPDQNIAHFLDV